MDRAPSNSRRLTGPNLFLPGFGVVLEAPMDDREAEPLIAAWEQTVRATWQELDWTRPDTAVCRYEGFATLAASAPEDALYTACEANETAWARALVQVGGTTAEHHTVYDLGKMSAAERSPRRRGIAALAAQQGVRCFADDEFLSVGSGAGSKTWPVDGLPDPSKIAWSEVRDIPVALVTGTNGKTTTVRMLAAIAAAARMTAGNTSTDGVQLGGETILEGDYTGGEGARALLRDRRVEVAFLEVARGGMLRRGLPVERADVAYVANIGTDHLGEYGIDTLERLADVKMVVAKAVDESGTLVANGDDRYLTPAFERPGTVAVRVDPAQLDDGPAFVRHHGRLGLVRGGRMAPWVEQADIPALLGGAAVHNVYNALGAMAVATGLGLSRHAVVEGLSGFASDPETNPGRCNVFDLGGARAIVDYAHNPEGLELVLGMVDALSAKRSLIVMGQAGDRADESLDALADVCAAHRPDRVIVKTMDKYGRGRDPAEVAARLLHRLEGQGMGADALSAAPDEMSAMRAALEWCQDGDTLLLLSHAARTDVLDLLTELSDTAWRPGSPLPSSG
jgi:UDP-N-acetylmuramyl tripeptide synthase